MEVSFYSFAGTRKDYAGCESVVDVCLHAMEENVLPIFAEQWGYYLWEYFTLTPDQLARICALLQLQRLPASLLWKWHSCVLRTRRSALGNPYPVSQDPDAMAALTRIEFLWQDLDTVQAYISIKSRTFDVKWIAAEIAKRRQWFTGLRRLWLLATTCFP